MTSDIEAIGRKAVACRVWRWMPGMLVCVPDGDGRLHRVVSVDDDKGPWAAGRGYDAWTNRPAVWSGWWKPEFQRLLVPDLSDAATRGVVLELVREVLGRPRAFLAPFWTADGDGPATWWRLEDPELGPLTKPRTDRIRYLAGRIEAEALVCALEAA